MVGDNDDGGGRDDGTFGGVEQTWIGRLTTLRNVVRQEVIARQLADHVGPGMTVLDVGCGQGTQAVGLARRGCVVTGVDRSADLLARCQEEAARQSVTVTTVLGSVEALADAVDGATYDVVCAHGLLMYLPDRAAALASITARVRPGGLLSVTFRNGDALAMRPALRGDWAAAADALTSTGYVNELGAATRADTREDIESALGAIGFRTVAWYGVRVFTDAVPAEAPTPDEPTLRQLIDVEDEGGRRDPYRGLGSMIHLVARHGPHPHVPPGAADRWVP